MDADKPPNVDALIDAVARAMTDGTPSDALRPEVQRRIVVPPPRIAVRWTRAAAVAAAVIVAAVALWRWHDRADAPGPADRAPAIARFEEPPGAPARREPAEAAAAPVIERRTARGLTSGQRDRQSPIADTPSTVEIAPLAIAPLSAAAIEVDALGSPGIDIEPISIRPLATGPSAGDALE